METEVKGRAPDAGVNWRNAAILLLCHVGAVVALFYWSWQAAVVAALLAWLSLSPGIGMGYHRLLTHRGYVVPKALEYLLTVCGTLAVQDGAIDWVVTHRIHHAHTDRGGDPHSPRQGRWWSHAGWLLTGNAQRHDAATLARYAPDLMRDRVHVWLNRFYYLPLVAVGLLLLAFGGFGVMLWGVCLRVTVGLHVTWLVNSATHLWGRQRFETGDDSRNSLWVALLTFGEGWHNNHHAYPTSARHGLAWYEFDPNWLGIRLLRLCGLAKSVKQVSLEATTAERWLPSREV
ncbi:MAG TPA: fatty acid desaturase [Pyrinomonadaceae bacterium]|jgi:stearoyl-CoA desaturase (delta-9 desaturase)|nr:fatty acid desaturase [Pyrinomonadaceae bacterium]